MEAVGTGPRPMIAISGRCFRMIATPVSREFVFQRTSNEPIVRPRMSMCRIASWSVSMIRQEILFIRPLFHQSNIEHRRPDRPGVGAAPTPSADRDEPPDHGSVIGREILDVLDKESHESQRLESDPASFFIGSIGAQIAIRIRNCSGWIVNRYFDDTG